LEENFVKAVFFDVDGTLFDTRADLADGVNHTRRDLGLEPLALETVISHVGQGSRYLMEHCIPESPMPFADLWAVYTSHYEEHCCSRLQMYPNVIETLDELKSRGYLLGVNTNKPNFAVKKIFDKFGLAEYFGHAVVAGGDGVPLKPDAASIARCAELLGHKLGEADWMVGDSWNDLQCAANAGVKGAFCSFGFGEIKNSPYDAYLRSFEELLDYLK
jgi:phosphoglycolate phosphatase